jgi:hypothetical protein
MCYVVESRPAVDMGRIASNPSYVAYIDEAGDPGITKVRPIDPVGGTEWMTIGCALIQRKYDPRLPDFVGDILKAIHVRTRPDLHFRHLSKTRQEEVCALIARMPLKLFCVCSNKRNMRQYDNPRAASRMHSKQWLYNFLVRLLIERVTSAVAAHSEENFGERRYVKFVFSRRGGHSYSQTKAYHELMRLQARAKTTVLKYRIPTWSVMSMSLIEVADHNVNAGLQIADCVASAFYTACDDLDTGPRYILPAQRLKPRMAEEHGRIADFGLVLQPNPYSRQISTKVRDGVIDEGQRAIFEFYGFNFQNRK